MNIIEELINRIESYRKENKKPCKNYSTYENANKALAEEAKRFADQVGSDESAHYIVFFVPGWNRWTGAIDINEMMSRKNTGGYLGTNGFYTF